MGKLIDYFVNRSLLVNLISLIIVLVGVLSIFNLQKETFPRVDFETITITSTYPGASAEDVEKLVSIPIERELKDVEGVEEMNVLSGEGYSIAVLKVDQDYLTDDVLDDARNAVDAVSDLPSDVERPKIKKIENKLRPIIKVGITGNEEWELRKLSKKLRDEIEQVKGIAKADLVGYREEIFDVAINPSKLLEYEITMGEVTSAIRDRNTNIAGGSIMKGEKEVIVRTLKEYKNKDDIGRVVVRSNSSGSRVTVFDLGEVEKVLKVHDERISAKGKMTVILDVVAKSNANVISTTDAVKKVTQDFVNKLARPEIGYTYFDDLSFFVKRRLNVLTKNGLQGMLLVFFCLLAFLNFRVSLMTSLGAPLAFLVSFALMESLGISINLISMFGLILVLGMLVDDSIIVSENFYQYLEKGYEPHEAAKIAAKETLAPVTATILTTMIAFGALFFMGGIMGKFLWPVPAVVIVCLLASWIECFFILPSHLSDFVKISKKKKEKNWYKPLMNFYEKILIICLKRKKITVASFFIVFLLSIGTLFTMKFELFPGDDVQVLNLKIKGKVGTPIKKTQQLVSQLENIVMENLNDDELMNLYATIGTLKSAHAGKKQGSHYGQILIHLTMQDFRERSTEEIIKLISSKTKNISKDFEISLDKKKGGPPGGKPINVELSGESLKELKEYSYKIQNMLKEHDGVIATELDYEEGKLQYIVDIDENEARRLGLTNHQIALEIRRAYEGEVATVIRESDNDIDIKVRLNEEARKTELTLDNLYILNNRQNRIALKKIATIREEPGSFVIRRFNRKRTFSISGEIDKRKANAFALNKKIRVQLDELLKDTSLNYELTGENKDTEESMESFKRASIISMFLIFIILVAMFASLGQPLIIMTAIPLGLIGVIFTFKLFNMPIGFMAMMGIIGLVGVVVNDSIVLVSFINNGLKKSDEIFETIKNACLSRFRPVILTTFTTVAGLLPLAHTPGGDPFLRPMAISFAYGLIFSTTLTLLFVPCVYFIYENLRRRVSRVKVEG